MNKFEKRCENCQFVKLMGTYGECRYSNPIAVYDGEFVNYTVWPQVGLKDWCGKYQAVEQTLMQTA